MLRCSGVVFDNLLLSVASDASRCGVENVPFMHRTRVRLQDKMRYTLRLRVSEAAFDESAEPLIVLDQPFLSATFVAAVEDPLQQHHHSVSSQSTMVTT